MNYYNNSIYTGKYKICFERTKLIFPKTKTWASNSYN